MKNNQKGITLVALVITIIVLLILAGVTIAALSGENGILRRASQSAVDTKVSQAKEIIINSYNAAVAEYYNERYVNGTTTGTVANAQNYVATKMAADTDITGYKAVKITVTPATTGNSTAVFTVDNMEYTGTISNATDGKGTNIAWTEAEK